MRALYFVPIILVAACTASTSPPGPQETEQLSLPRAAHTATALQDGRVLIAGGCTTAGCGGNTAQTEIFDPARGKFRAGPPMTRPRGGHSATRLHDGRVLLIGGYPDEGRPPLAEAEVFDPKTGVFTAVGALSTGRGSHTATLLNDGRVLVVGGVSGRATLSTVELFDPATGAFTGAAAIPEPRATHGAVRLTDGKVIVVGGQSIAGHGNGLLGTTLVYDPVAANWARGPDLLQPKYKLAVAPLPDGRALVLGGQTADDAASRLRQTEILSPGGAVAGPLMSEPRYKISDAVVVLANGDIVVAGNLGADVYRDGKFTALKVPPGPERQTPAVAALPGNRVLITGGYSEQTLPTASVAVVGNIP